MDTPTAAKPLSQRQADVLAYIRDYINANDHAPTLQQIGEHFGLSKVCIFEHVRELERKGWITREAHKSRGIRLVEDVCPRCGRATA